MEGRDICTYVFPNADVKIYLDGKENEKIDLTNKATNNETQIVENLEEEVRSEYGEDVTLIIKKTTASIVDKVLSIEKSSYEVVQDEGNTEIVEETKKTNDKDEKVEVNPASSETDETAETYVETIKSETQDESTSINNIEETEGIIEPTVAGFVGTEANKRDRGNNRDRGNKRDRRNNRESRG